MYLKTKHSQQFLTPNISRWNGSVTHGLGADISLTHCLSVTSGIWSLAHESDHQAEIWGSIVRFDTPAPRPEELLSWYRLCMRSFPRTDVLATFLRKRIRVVSIKYQTPSRHLKVLVYFSTCSSLKLGIGNNTVNCFYKTCKITFISMLMVEPAKEFLIMNAIAWKIIPSFSLTGGEAFCWWLQYNETH